MRKKKFYLEAKSPLSQKIHITEKYWDYVVQEKHPSIRNQEKFVLQSLTDPDTIRASQKELTVWLFYKRLKRIYLCVVVKILNSEGFIITIYFTQKIKRGEIIWQK